MSRWTAAYLAVVGGLASLVVAAVIGFVMVSGPDDPGAEAGEDHAYDVISFELKALPQKWLYKIGSIFRGGSDMSDDEALNRYFSLSPLIARLGVTDPDSEDLAAARKEQRDLENRVEDIIEGRMTALLEDEGLAMEMPIFSDLGIIFPPVDFELDEPPNVLAVSPRGRLDLDDSYLLSPSLDLATVEAIEDEVEADNGEMDGLSARILRTGGVATYPAVLNAFDSYPELVDTAFHEWVHQYLVFFPLGRSYFAGSDARTINETVASISGRELARAYLERYGNVQIDDDGQSGPVADAGDARPTGFDFFEEMRQLRVDVEALLEDGEVLEAEALMDAKRDEFEDNGYYIREINQAYFAYRGFYATGSGSIDPLGPNLEQVYRRSGSPGEFLRSVAGITTRDEVDALLSG